MPAKKQVKKPVVRRKQTAAKKPTARKVAPKPPAKKPTAKPRDVRKSAVKRGMSFEEKARMLYDYAKENGWWAKIETKPIIKLTAKKDDGRFKDTIACEWEPGAKHGVLLLVLEDGRNIRFRNLAAVKAHIDGSRTVKRDVQRKQRKPKMRVGLDGEVISRKGDDDYKPIGADIVDHWSHIRGKPRKGKRGLAPVIRIGYLLKPRAEVLAAELESEGYDVTVVPHTTDGHCEFCEERPPVKATSRPTPSRPAAKQAAKTAPTRKPATKKVARKKPVR